MSPLAHAPLFTALYLGLITLLAILVSWTRIRQRISLGDGNNKKMRGAMRAHVNALEHMIPFLLLLICYEWQGAPKNWVWLLGWFFFGARVMHAIGMVRHRFLLRRIGAGLTYLFQIGLVIAILVRYFSN